MSCILEALMCVQYLRKQRQPAQKHFGGINKALWVFTVSGIQFGMRAMRFERSSDPCARVDSPSLISIET